MTPDLPANDGSLFPWVSQFSGSDALELHKDVPW